MLRGALSIPENCTEVSTQNSTAIQEAHGGRKGDDTEYREYTPVIYLSDTTEDAVHAAADELVKTFNQSPVLIRANPTTTEFYSGSEH